MAIGFGKNSLPAGFARSKAQELVGATVCKRLVDPDNPSVPIGQIGKVIDYEKSDISNGYLVIVDWGGGELWQYLRDDFVADACIVDEKDCASRNLGG